jgi:hypothetical protein
LRVSVPRKYVLELVHARVGEQQRGVIVRDDRRAGHERVGVLVLEEVDELLTNFSASATHGAFLSSRQL